MFSKGKDEEVKWGRGVRRGVGDRAALLAQGDPCVQLSAGFPAFCHFCLGRGASSARISPRRAPLQPGLVYISTFSLPCTETLHHERQSLAPRARGCCEGGGLLPATCHSHPAFLGRALASHQGHGGVAFSPLPILHATPRAAAHACMPPPSQGTPR